MLHDRPRLLVIDEEPARRLEIVAWLAAHYDAWPLPEGEDPLRSARTGRPDMALIVLGRQPDRALRLSRALRTDTRPVPRVGVLEGGGRPKGAFVAMELWMADGWLGLPTDEPTLVGFVGELWRGERPNQPTTAAPHPVRSLLRRLRGKGVS